MSLALGSDVDTSVGKHLPGPHCMLGFHYDVGFGSIGMVSIRIWCRVLADFPTTFLGHHKCRHLWHRPHTILVSLQGHPTSVPQSVVSQQAHTCHAQAHTWPCVVPSEEVISPSPQMMHLIGALYVFMRI